MSSKKIPNPYAIPTKVRIQAKVDAANLLLVFAIGQRLGLCAAGMINEAACEEALAEGSRKGVTPKTPGPASA